MLAIARDATFMIMM